ncbi:hypothetical protein XENTR_v10022314 [Xenopus tropicalis]|nr:hypothetical protein XENTR_v10022314 [Xenopus tropicalis]
MFKRISKAFRKLFRRNNKVAPLISNDTESSCKIVPTPLHLLPVNYGIETQKKEEIREPLDERLERIAQNTPVTTESSVGTTEESSSESGSILESATQNVPKQERFILVQEARKSQTVSLDTCIATERTEPRVKHVKFIFVKEAKKSEEKKESSDSETESDDLENSTEPRVKQVKFTFVEDAEKSEEKEESSDSETESDDLENSTPSIQNSPVCQELARAEEIEADIAVQDDTISLIEKISWTSVEDFRFCKFLGKGSFGKVYLAEHKKTQNMVAIKAMNKADIHKNQMLKSLLLEKNIMKFVQIQRTPFVMGLISAFQSEHRVFFSMELATGGDLESVIKKGAISHSSAVFYSACIVLGIQFLHENGIVHRDLKPANVLIDKDGYAKISDFGLSIAGIGYGCTMNQPVGTPLYKAPEVYEARPYTRSVDWWALGAMIYKMVVGHVSIKHLFRYYVAL